jgi:polyhydroxyalkanoate synthesis regulator phasin
MTGKAYRNKEDEMADFKFGDGIKTIILAGVGAVAYSAEKGQEIIGELVKKGEITVEQGKDLSSDLQRSFKESMGKRGIDIDEISEKVSKMSSEELAKIKEQLANAEKLVSERLKKVEEEAGEEAAEAPAEEAPAEEPAEEAAEAPAEEEKEEAAE